MSAASFLEVVETDDGEIVLRRTDSSPGSTEPLVRIRFSPEARAFLGEHLGDIGRGMIGTGVQLAGQLASGATDLADDEPRLLH